MSHGDFTELNPKVFLQGLFELSSTQKQKLGTRRTLSDGREFVYAKAGANLVAGRLVQGAVTDVANHANLACANANANDRSVTVTLGNLLATANMYAEGYLHINAGLGAGGIYKIKSHPAANANATVALALYDKLLSNLASANSKGTLNYHPCASVIIHASVPTAKLVGNPIQAVGVNEYAWFQTKGPSPVDTDGTLVVGQPAHASTAADGTVQPSSGNAIDMIKVPIAGTVITVNANDAWSLIDLNIT